MVKELEERELTMLASAAMAQERSRSPEDRSLVEDLVREVLELRADLAVEAEVNRDLTHQLAVDAKHASGDHCDVCTHLEAESMAEALDDAYDRLDELEAAERERLASEGFYRAIADAFRAQRESERYPCGHAQMVSGCGGCDPGAIEFVLEDGSSVLRAFDPARDMIQSEK